MYVMLKIVQDIHLILKSSIRPGRFKLLGTPKKYVYRGTRTLYPDVSQTMLCQPF